MKDWGFGLGEVDHLWRGRGLFTN